MADLKRDQDKCQRFADDARVARSFKAHLGNPDPIQSGF